MNRSMNSARVQSIDAIKAFRISLWKFAEGASRVLDSVDAETQRMLVWLETEQQTYWRGQIQRRTQMVAQAKQALLAKKLYKNADGTRSSAAEEEKALKVAVQRLEEANEKLVNVRRYIPRLQKQILLYRGQVQRFSNVIQIEIPAAANHLDALVTSLEAYVSADLADRAAASEAGAPGALVTGDALPSMARSEPGGEAQPADVGKTDGEPKQQGGQDSVASGQQDPLKTGGSDGDS